jgi:hypothetical protein
MKRSAILVSVWAFASACGELPHDAAYDPQSPAAKQAKATLTGSVALEGEADASSVTVELQGADRTYSVVTGADGAYRIAGVTPGLYQVTFKTRYFTAQTDTVSVPLGEAVVLQARRLLARRASMNGSALIERLEDRALTRVGGAGILLTKTASVRGGAAAAPGFRAAAVTVDTFTLTALAGADGAFTLNGVPAGVYRLVITGERGEGAELDGITVTGESPVVTLDPLVVQAVTGFFDILGTAGFAESSAYTSTPVVTLRLSGFNAASMRIGTSASGAAADCALADAMPYQAVTTLTLPAEGEAVVCVQFIGADGRTTDVLTDSIVYDGSAPYGGVVGVNGGAAFVTTAGGNVTLALTAFDEVTRLADMQVANKGAGTCAEALSPAAIEPFVTVKAWTLGNPKASAPGYRTVCARFADIAGNWSNAATAAVYFDPQLYAPGFTARLRGAEGRTDRTRGAKVKVELAFTGATTDVTGVLVANDASFAGVAWRAFATPVTWSLESGDGLKTVYVKVRDFAGNESARLQPQITLDQSGPETPVLALNDIDGDGFPLSSTTVELRWTTPSDADLAGFEIERFVEGVDTQFGPRATPGAAVSTLRDDTAATSGYPHHYRIRATDDLGNGSSYSTVLSARPFTPVSSLRMLRGNSEVRYFMQPLSGTFLVSTDWLYEYPFPGDQFRDQLGFNVLDWTRSATFSGFNDEFLIRTSNVDNTLVYESDFKPGHDTRGFGGQPLGGGSAPSLGVAADGTVNIIYTNSGVFHATNAGGTWTTGARYATIDLGSPKAGFAPNGNIVMPYAIFLAFGPMPIDLRSGGVWSTQTNPDQTVYGPAQYEAKMDTAANAYITYVGGFDSAASATMQGVRLIVRNAAAGTWAGPYPFDAAGGTATALTMARSSTRTCFAYMLAGTSLRYACRTDPGGTVAPVTLAGAAAASATAIGVKSNNQFVIAYVESATSDLKVWDQTSGTTTTLHTDAATPALAIDANNTAHLAFRSATSNDLLYFHNASGTWTGRTLSSQGTQGYNPSIAVGPDGKIHIAYGDSTNGQLGYVVLEAPYAKRIATGIEALDTKTDAAGNVHFVYRLTSTGNLYYAKWNGTTLTATNLDADLTLVKGPSLALDPAGKVHIVYPNEADTAIRYATNASGGWQFAQLLAVASNMTPRIAYAGGQCHVLASGKYIRGTYGSFTSETIAGLPDGAGDIAVDTAGKVHVVAYPAALIDIGTLVHKSGSFGSWSAGFSDTGWYTSQTLGAGADGKMHLAANLNGDLVHVVISGATSTRSTVDAGNNVGTGVRFAFDAAGSMHLVYGDTTNGAIRYATDALTGAFQSIELAKSATLDENGIGFAADGSPIVAFGNGDLVLMKDFVRTLPAASVARTTAY